MNVSDKAIFGIEGVKLSLQAESKRLAELSEELNDLHLSLDFDKKEKVLNKIIGTRNAIDRCNSTITYYIEILEALYEDYHSKPVSLTLLKTEVI